MDASENHALSIKKFPEKFEILSRFFDSLDSAMRLLRLKSSPSNFSNVCPKVELLTDRRFSHGRLAQLKFILPEAIELRKVLVFDEKTSCLKPDLHISFNFGVLDNQDDLGSGNQNMQLRKLFRERLSEFVSFHPEIDDVPKGLLPKPFNFPSQDHFPETNSSSFEQPAVSFNHHSEESQGFRIIKSMVPSKRKEFIGTSHFSQSFSRRFSRKVVRDMEKTEEATEPCEQSSSHSDAETEFCEPSSPVKVPSNSTCHSDCLVISTPAKLVSTPVRLMVSTPAIPPPKRSSMSSDDDSSCSANTLVRRPPLSRSLLFEDKIGVFKNSR